jgi:hypothetical protein
MVSPVIGRTGDIVLVIRTSTRTSTCCLVYCIDVARRAEADHMVMRRSVALTVASVVIRVVLAPSLMVMLVSMILMVAMPILTIAFDLAFVVPKVLTRPYTARMSTTEVGHLEVRTTASVRVTDFSEQIWVACRCY